MAPGTIVYQGTSKTGTYFLFRYPKPGDEIAMTEYINTLSQEKTYITYQGEAIPLEEEKAFLESQLKEIAQHKAVLLLAFSGDMLIGITGIEMKTRTSSHVGVLGISLAKRFRGQGIGRLFLEKVLDEGRKHIHGLQIVTLGVFATNPLAISLYEEVGFKMYGRLPRGVKHNGELVDHLEMYLNLKS